MLINEVSKKTNLTKKAIEYYTYQGLVSLIILDNGYRDYSKSDIEKLYKIGILRKLDISVEEIKMIINDKTYSTLQEIYLKKNLEYKYNLTKKSIKLRRISFRLYKKIIKWYIIILIIIGK